MRVLKSCWIAATTLTFGSAGFGSAASAPGPDTATDVLANKMRAIVRLS